MIVGIDIGTQSLKAVVTDPELNLIGAAASDYQPDYPRPGWAEQDPLVWEQALRPAITQALRKANIAPDAVTALGLCGQLDGCVACDAEGRALSPCIIWLDRRAEAEIAGLPADLVRNRSGVVLDATHMAAKIRWLKRHLPAGRQARLRVARFHQPVSYLVSRLTGAQVFDHGLASTTMLYKLAQRGFDEELLALFEITAEELPAIAEPGNRAGELTRQGAELTGLPQGLPVAVGTGDDFSNLLGAGVVENGSLVCALGTAEVVGALHHAPVIDPAGLVETHSYAGKWYFLENPGWLSGGALRWFVDTFRLRDFTELDTLAAQAPAGADGVNFLPALSGAMAPEWIATARGCYYGMTPAHGNNHLARATLEGCAFAMRDVLERLTVLGVAVDNILLLGGGARSALWAQIRADLTGLPVVLSASKDASPVGAALLAAVAAGQFPDITSAARRVYKIDRVFRPNPHQKAAYDSAYAAYRLLFESLKPVYSA